MRGVWVLQRDNGQAPSYNNKKLLYIIIINADISFVKPIFLPIFGYIDHKSRVILMIFNFTDESVLTFIYSYDTVSLWYVTIFY